MANVHLPIRQLVEFLLRTGSIDSRFTGFDRANEGARIHRKLQKAAGEGYQAEVFLSAERETCGIAFTLEGRADGILLTGGLMRYDDIRAGVEQRCGWIAPISVYPGECEQEAMANAVLEVLRGERQASRYTGAPVFQGFDWEQ